MANLLWGHDENNFSAITLWLLGIAEADPDSWQQISAREWQHVLIAQLQMVAQVSCVEQSWQEIQHGNETSGAVKVCS